MGSSGYGKHPERPRVTPKQKVLKKYPKAFCEMNGHYVQIVSPLPYGEVKVLGVAMGWNRSHYFKAWAAAAHNLRAVAKVKEDQHGR